jgi:hypothetical protein
VLHTQPSIPTASVSVSDERCVPLSSLSVEIVCMILFEIDSIRDLYSFIRTSSQMQGAFLGLKEQILSDLLKRVVAPEVLGSDAQIAVRASQFPFSRNSDDHNAIEEATSFLRFIRSVEKIDVADQVIPLKLSIPLCRF